MNKEQSINAIRANLQIIYSSLHKASQEVLEAIDAIDNGGNQNRAIGAILEVPDRLDAAKTFCDAIMRIHRNYR
jgi:hypothetical protein